jgi:hypothetical protein
MYEKRDVNICQISHLIQCRKKLIPLEYLVLTSLNRQGHDTKEAEEVLKTLIKVLKVRLSRRAYARTSASGN